MTAQRLTAISELMIPPGECGVFIMNFVSGEGNHRSRIWRGAREGPALHVHSEGIQCRSSECFLLLRGITCKYLCNPVPVLGKLLACAFAERSPGANKSRASRWECTTRYLRVSRTSEAEISAH
jgi:hypothetical protein